MKSLQANTSPRWLLVALVLLALMSQGCTWRGYAGYAASEQHHALQVSAHVDFIVIGGSTRVKVGPNIAEMGVGAEVGWSVPDDGEFFYCYGGLNVLNLGVVDEEFRVGAGSPYAQIGWGICEDSSNDTGTCYTLGLDTEAMVRFGPTEVEPFFGVVFGVNLFTAHKHAAPRR